METAKTLIIILHYGSVEDTLECLESLRRFVVCPFDIFVVNNGPDKGVRSTLMARHPDVMYRYAGVETGFAAGNNIGLRFSIQHGYRYSLILNNDTVAESDFLQPLIALLERSPTIAMTGPAIYYYFNTKRLWSCGGRIRKWTGCLGGITKLAGLDAETSDVDYLPGACILVRNSALQKIGLMIDDYFLGMEEADWAIQARRVGYRVVGLSKSTLLHKVGVSARYTPELIYNGIRNRFLILRRQFMVPLSSFLILCVLGNELRKHKGHRWLCWRALRDHWRYKSIRRNHLDAVQAELRDRV